jgi:hypothetical protein
MAERGNAFRVLMGKPEEKRCKGNIKVDLETAWKAQEREEWRVYVNTVLNCRIPYDSAPWGCFVS